MGWTTSASTRKVAVSDQTSALTVIMRPSCSILGGSMLVNGHGPAMQDARMLRNSLPTPASRVAEPIAAFHFPSGEHGGRSLHSSLPLFCTSKGRAALATFITVAVLIEYRTTILLEIVWVARLRSRGFSG